MDVNLIDGIARPIFRQVRALAKLAAGHPLPPSLGSMTLDADDAATARRWLSHPERWYERGIVTQYEAAFAKWNGSRHAFSFMSGREALSACLAALDLKEGDEVVVPGYTCVVVPNAFRFAGVRIVYADIELDTYGLEADSLRRCLTPKTRAVLVHHLYGLVCRDLVEILNIAKEHGLMVIEDCAHATGAEFKGRKVGNFGHVSFYSSEQSKVFSTIQGGMAVTNDDRIAKGLKAYYEASPEPSREWIDRQLHHLLLNYYQFKHPLRHWLGHLAEIWLGDKRLISTTPDEERGLKPYYYGRRMAAPIAALGLTQLAKVDSYNEHRRQTAKRWDTWCEENGLQKPVLIPDSVPVFLRYPVLVTPERKQDPSWALSELGVSVGVWFVSHIHPTESLLPECPNAATAVACCINLPGVLPSS